MMPSNVPLTDFQNAQTTACMRSAILKAEQEQDRIESTSALKSIERIIAEESLKFGETKTYPGSERISST